MLLNHILTIEKAGGRKADIGLFDRVNVYWLWNIQRFISIFLQREEENGRSKDH